VNSRAPRSKELSGETSERQRRTAQLTEPLKAHGAQLTEHVLRECGIRELQRAERQAVVPTIHAAERTSCSVGELVAKYAAPL
jgi:hypothetical protein